MNIEKSKFRQFIGLFLVVAFLFNAAIPAYAEFSVTKNSEQLKSIFGNKFQICSAHGTKTISANDYYKLLHSLDDTDKRINSDSKNKLAQANLPSENFIYAAKNYQQKHYSFNQAKSAQIDAASHGSRAPPHKII